MTQTIARPARAAAIARQDEAIQQNVQRIEATKRASALDVMAARLNITSTGLKSTLMNTVFRIKENGKFRSPTDDEFAALVIVANEYRLNPLTKEIYAYPAKGGGIVPVVSIDGWLRIINEHPQFDGMEHKDIPDENGKLLAIETTIWRKDRSRPIRIPEYLSECKQNTDPWRNMPARMLRHKSTIQCGRYAFGFAGIYAEGDAEIGTVSLGSDLQPMPMRDVTPRQDEQPRQLVRPEVEERTVYDPNTGEIESEDEAAARLDREGYAAMEGRDVSQQGEAHATVDEADAMIAEILEMKSVPDVNSYMSDADFSLLDDDQAERVRTAAAEHSELIKRAAANAAKAGQG